MIDTLLYSLAGPRRSNFGTGDRACDCYSVASSFELVSIVCERFPANEAILHSFAFLAIGSCGCRESSSKVDMIRTRTYSFDCQGDPISKQGIVCMVVFLFASSLELVSAVYVRFPANEAILHSFAFLAIGSCGCREFS